MSLIIILYSLAIWRITYMIVEEDGPGDIIKKIRLLLGKKYSPLNCFYCTSIWISAIFCYYVGLDFFYIFALSGASVFIQAVHERLWLPL